MRTYTLLPSTSEHKIRVYGRDWPGLVTNALKGMFASIDPKAALDRTPRRREVDVSAFDRESLLVNFLSEALYLSAVHHEAYCEAQFSLLSAVHATGVITGYKIDGFAGSEIKAVTHHGIHITQKNSILQTDILFDV